MVWRTTDGGETWMSAKVGERGASVVSLAMHDDSVGVAGLAGYWNFAPQFARTVDGGATWQTLPAVKPDQAWAAAFVPGSTKAWMAGVNTVACSRDNGISWVLEQTESFTGNLNAISFSDSANGWVTTDSGNILRYHDLSATTAVKHEGIGTLPVQTRLEQNYPNPFNPNSNIRYQISDLRHVELVVYDLLGRKVKTLVNEVKQPGTYTVQFDAAGLSSGVYFYKLIAGSFVATKKLLLMK